MDIININTPNKYQLNAYKYPSCEFPKFTTDESYSNYSTLDVSKNKSDGYLQKHVEFSNDITVINIESYKKEMRKNFHGNKMNLYDEEININNCQKCANCNIF